MAIGETSKFVLQYALNPKMCLVRREIFSFIIIDLLQKKHSALDLTEIRNEMFQSYGINLPPFITEQTLEQLKKEGLVSSSFEQERRRITFSLVETNIKYIEFVELSKEYTAKYDSVINSYFERLSKYYKKELLPDQKKILVAEFVGFCDKLAKKLASESLAVLNDEWITEEFKRDLVLKSELSGINTELLNAQNRLIRELSNEFTPGQILNEFIQLRVFWITFTSIIPYNKETRTELLKKLRELRLFLDTNVLMSAVCHYHEMHFVANRNLDHLRNMGVQLFYLDETERELKKSLEQMGTAVKVLNSFPYEQARLIARETGNAILIAFYEEGYKTWEKYYNSFMKDISKLGIQKRNSTDFTKDLGKLDKEIERLSTIFDAIGKTEGTIHHDAFLRAFIGSLRSDTDVKGELRRYWILTMDKTLENYDLGMAEAKRFVKGKDPKGFTEISIGKGELVVPAEHFPYFYIPISKVLYLFDSLLLAQSVSKDVNSMQERSESAYRSILDVSRIVPINGKKLRDAIQSVGELKTKDDAENRLMNYMREVLGKDNNNVF